MIESDGFGRRRFLGVLGGVVGGSVLMTHGAQASTHGVATRRVYLGCYTLGTGGGKGIGLADADLHTGALKVVSTVEGVVNPSFLTLAPNRRTVYAVNETTEGRVSAFAVDANGGLKALGSQSALGADPCHLAVHPSGRYVLTANYSSGSVAVHPIREGGALGPATDLVQHKGSGPDPDRQQGPHAHQVLTDPSGRWLHAVDLGTDSVYVYRLDLGTGKLKRHSQAKLKPGAGPRHIAFHPNGTAAYVANELDSTITVCAWDAVTGKLTPGATVPTAPAGGAVRNYPAEVIVSADGRFVYLSNRGHDSIAIFAVGAAGRALKPVGTPSCGGAWPRHIVLTNDGRFLYVANERSPGVAVFQVDRATGGLTRAGTALSTPRPVCVVPA
ncbi:lactonase family protein [Allokutzneria sp. A3M-2-11 16]|uniref:lactonase family protein n=1 Tax=Allokutzneria sp. A3M-2-11 16 TaxID=2962043 RepID=UPI0020B7C7D7|nr:lactonase family protein [Allokutzneria sp. A3M-2-11 16]MCP3802750.1 lactonase family protein [Allokutzneria sp. A3M-2-11 16]